MLGSVLRKVGGRDETQWQQQSHLEPPGGPREKGDRQEEDEGESLSSYLTLCGRVLSQIVPDAFSSQWLGCGYSLPAVLAMGLAVHGWHRWTLLYDPEGLAVQWLQEWRGEKMMTLDYRER